MKSLFPRFFDKPQRQRSRKGGAAASVNDSRLAEARLKEAEYETLEPRMLFSAAPVEPAPDAGDEAPAADSQPESVTEIVVTPQADQGAAAALETVESAQEGSVSGSTLSGQTEVALPEGNGDSELSVEQGVTLVDLDEQAATLNQETLDAIADAAAERWRATGLTADQSAALDSMSYQSGNLPGFVMGRFDGDGWIITIDNNASGVGWFFDRTPDADEEFDTAVSAATFLAEDGAAVGKVDLLTVLMHEQGHALGLMDGETGAGIMAGAPHPGTRMLPTAGQAMGAVAGSVAGIHSAAVTADGLLDVVDGDTSDIGSLIATKGADGVISLREAIIAANGTAGNHTITLVAGTYTLSIAGRGEDAAATGDLDITSDITLTGAGSAATIIDVDEIDRAFDILAGASLDISGVKVQDGLTILTGQYGGGFRNLGTLTITDSVIDHCGNTGDHTGGGALGAIYSNGTLTIDNTTVTNSHSWYGVGTLYAEGTTTISNSLFYNNDARSSSEGNFYFLGDVSLVNTTISGNGSSGPNKHGGITMGAGVNATIINSTIGDNWNQGGYGALRINSGANVVMHNSIVSAWKWNTIRNDNRGYAFSGDSLDASSSNNLIQLAHSDLIGIGNGGLVDGVNGNIVTARDLVADGDILNTTLVDNGGPTRTHALVSGSPAIDAGDNAQIPVGVTTDQRGAGYPRIQNSTVDIGAYEMEAVPEIDVQRGATSIADGGSDDLGTQIVGTVNLSYTIDNTTGTAELTIPAGGVTASNLSNSSGFSVDTSLPLTVAAGATGTLEVSFDVDGNGAFSFDLDIANNDSDENPYDIHVEGTGVVLTVDTFLDENDGDYSAGDLSLREAIILANADPGANTITLQAGTYTLSIAGRGEDAAATGDLDITSDITLTGAGSAATIIDVDEIDRAFDILAGASLDISGVKVQDGLTILTGQYGGGFRNLGTLTITDSVIDHCGNTGDHTGGGALGAIYSNGTLTIDNTTVTNSHSWYGVGTLYAEGTTTISNSLFYNNDARSSSEGNFYFLGDVSLVNTTISGNGSSGPNKHGGITMGAGVNATIINSTIGDNWNQGGYGALRINSGANVVMHNSIVSAWKWNTIRNDNRGYAFSGDSLDASSSNNLIQLAHSDLIGIGDGGLVDGVNGNIVTARDLVADGDILNTSLADNGGPTRTHALVSGSPAINAGDNAQIPVGVTTDQRGDPRVVGGTVDIGAYEIFDVETPNTASVDDSGNATINADDSPGSVTLSVDGSGNLVIGSGGSIAAGSGTTTDAQGNVLIPIGSLTTLTLDLRDGDDALIINDLTGFTGSLNLDGGDGQDTITFGADVMLAAGNDAILTAEEVYLNHAGIETTGDGSINIDATGSSGGTSKGINLAASNLTAGGTGSISLNGAGGDSGANNQGVQLSGGSTVSTNDGDIDIDGTSSGSASANQGIALLSGSSISAGGSGNLTLDGTGSGSGTTSNHGVSLAAGTSASVENGTMIITGMGAGSGGLSHGVNLLGSLTGSGSGNITVIGSSTGTGNNNAGVYGSNASIDTSTGSGSVTLRGTGSSSGVTSNYGVGLANFDIMTGGDGAIDIDGLGGGTGAGTTNIGVSLQTGSKLAAAGAGSMTIDGTGGSGTYFNRGVYVVGAGSSLTSADGNVEIRGTANGSGGFNHGMEIKNTALSSTGTGAVTLAGTGSASAAGASNLGIYLVSNTISAVSGNMTLTGIGGTGTNYNEGVRVQYTSVSTGGTLAITGSTQSGTTGSNNSGIYLLGATLNGGAASMIDGSGGGGTTGNHGITNVGVLSSNLAGSQFAGHKGTGGTSTDLYGTFPV